MLQLRSLYIKNFRCFDQLSLNLESPVVLIEGTNGAGKTTLLEALHYLCYLRSFRTHIPRDLIQFGHDNFFIKASLHGDLLEHEIQVGFSGKKRLVKVNQKAVSSYKELMEYYRIVTLTEDDLSLIKGTPEERRTFLDQAILLEDAEFLAIIRAFKSAVENRNSLLQTSRISPDNYMLWTRQLWEKTQLIQAQRRTMLSTLSVTINELLKTYFDEEITVSLVYQARSMKHEHDTFEQFMESHARLYDDEIRFKRSLFGAHLDDFSIQFQHKHSKAYASRGQQKLVILLIKIAQIKELIGRKGDAIFLLDDFMADFDEKRANTLLSLLPHLNCQLIFTTPTKGGFFEQKLDSIGAQRVSLTNGKE